VFNKVTTVNFYIKQRNQCLEVGRIEKNNAFEKYVYSIRVHFSTSEKGSQECQVCKRQSLSPLVWQKPRKKCEMKRNAGKPYGSISYECFPTTNIKIQ